MDIFFVIIIGLCIGSFVTVLLYRIPRKLPWGLEGGDALRSRCPKCHATLAPRDLIPLFSWVVNRGRCRHCTVHVAAFYPLVEIVTALIVLAVYLGFRAFSG